MITARARRAGLGAGLALALALPVMPAPDAGAQPAPPSAQVPVRVFKVGSDEPPGGITGLGTARCRQSLELGFEVTGQIAAVLVEEGQEVKRGQVLMRLDDAVVRSELAAKQAETVGHEAEAARLTERKAEKEKLLASRAVTQSEVRETGFELDKARARLEAGRREVAALQAKLASFTLKAPIDGVILKRQAEPGEVAPAGQRKVLKLGDCRRVLAEVEFGEKLYTRLRPGQEAVLMADALPGRQFRGEIQSLSPEVEEKNRTFVAKVAADNPGFAMKPGMFVRAVVRVEGAAAEQAAWIPLAALQADQGGRGEVTVIEDRRAVKRPVMLGRREGQRVEVVSGLKAGDQVLIGGGPEAPEPGRP